MTLARYTGVRILQSIPVLIGVATITFFLTHAIPGNPIEIMAGPSPSAAQVAAIKHKYGLDQPVYVQYLQYLWNLAHLDMGESLYYKTAVTAKIAQRLPVTLVLLAASFAFALVTAIPSACSRPSGATPRPTTSRGSRGSSASARPIFGSACCSSRCSRSNSTGCPRRDW